MTKFIIRKCNTAGIDLIKFYESCRLKAYQDTKGIWTIGWGATYYHNGKKVKFGDIITQAIADDLFLFHLGVFEREVNSLIKNDKINENQFSALVSFAFNCGSDIDEDTKAEGLGDSTLLKLVNINPNNTLIKAEFLKWISKGSKSERGLRNRRTKEAALYFSPVSLLA